MIHGNDMHFETYLFYLRELMRFPTLFTRPDQIESAMERCRDCLTRHLRGYRVYRDRQDNLIACPEDIDPQKDLIYLSAHLDTVDADASEWDPPFSPFSLYEDDHQMVGRGVSDCKAGVAFELFLAHLAGTGQIALSNLVFTITFKEEGAGIKTARQIGKDLGHALPVSRKDTFFIVLENNITVSTPPVLSFYTAERGNFVIRVSDTIDRLKIILSGLKQWNPVSIRPDAGVFGPETTVFTQKGGHVCSVPRKKNLLTRVIEQSGSTDFLLAGDESGFGVVPSTIKKGRTQSPVVHHLVLSNRSFDTVEAVKAQLDGIPYREVKDFSISQGMNFDAAFSTHPLYRFLQDDRRNGLDIRHTHNIGASDATIVTRCMPPEFLHRFYPIVMGPGTRSQRTATPPRLTHGKNETFDKKSGKAGVEFLVSVLMEMGGIHPSGHNQADTGKGGQPSG